MCENILEIWTPALLEQRGVYLCQRSVACTSIRAAWLVPLLEKCGFYLYIRDVQGTSPPVGDNKGGKTGVGCPGNMFACCLPL